MCYTANLPNLVILGQMNASWLGHLHLFGLFATFDRLHVLRLKRQSGAETFLALVKMTSMGPKHPRAEMTSGRMDQWPKRLVGAKSSRGRNFRGPKHP